MSDNLNQHDDNLPSSFAEREALEKKRYKLANKHDVFIILAILLLAASFWVYSLLRDRGELLVAHIYYYDQELESVALNGAMERTFSYDVHPEMVFRVNKDESIQVVSSDCPDQICVNAGPIHRAESFIACVPNGFLVSIHAESGEINEEVDIVN